MTVRTESVVLLTIAGLTGLVFAFTRGFWSAAPLLVIAAAGLFFHLMPPVPPEQPGRVWWANANLVSLVAAIGAAWYQSATMLSVGVLLVVVTLAVPRLKRTS
jgi:hypothetical protein